MPKSKGSTDLQKKKTTRNINKWWKRSPNERFWLEVTRRVDIGTNLKAPQFNEHGDDYWSYSLVNEVEEGDVVFHYDGVKQAIVAKSIAIGIVWEDDVVWAARGLSARTANVAPHARPGWYLGLERFQPLREPVSLEAIREKASELRKLKDTLTGAIGDPLYFPFEIGDRRPIRPMQGYLFKLPVDFLRLFALAVTSPDSDSLGHSPVQHVLGDPYRPADELATLTNRDPFAVDPVIVERGVRGHAITQNAVAQHLVSIGIEPRSPKADEPNFDIAWEVGDCIYVGEVKSLTVLNEEKQLRLGLGQVLRYANQLANRKTVVPVLVVERAPIDESWKQLCAGLGVVLAWPDAFKLKLVPH